MTWRKPCRWCAQPTSRSSRRRDQAAARGEPHQRRSRASIGPRPPRRPPPPRQRQRQRRVTESSRDTDADRPVLRGPPVPHRRVDQHDVGQVVRQRHAPDRRQRCQRARQPAPVLLPFEHRHDRQREATVAQQDGIEVGCHSICSGAATFAERFPRSRTRTGPAPCRRTASAAPATAIAANANDRRGR